VPGLPDGVGVGVGLAVDEALGPAEAVGDGAASLGLGVGPPLGAPLGAAVGPALGPALGAAADGDGLPLGGLVEMDAGGVTDGLGPATVGVGEPTPVVGAAGRLKSRKAPPPSTSRTTPRKASARPSRSEGPDGGAGGDAL
jgi:hypothetical protein